MVLANAPDKITYKNNQLAGKSKGEMKIPTTQQRIAIDPRTAAIFC